MLSRTITLRSEQIGVLFNIIISLTFILINVSIEKNIVSFFSLHLLNKLWLQNFQVVLLPLILFMLLNQIFKRFVINNLDISGICPSHSTTICQPDKIRCSADNYCPSSRLCCRDGCGDMTCQLPGRFRLTHYLIFLLKMKYVMGVTPEILCSFEVLKIRPWILIEAPIV